jgi:nicotinate-nucleotide adenylyltransferase
MTPPGLRESGRRWHGLRIGLLGGSFNPPHEGHVHISRLARAKFGLDFVWWIVTPQNPLKDTKDMRPYDERHNQVSDMLKSFPRHMPTHLEAEMKTRYTHETVTQMKKHFPHTDFIWICGMDNAMIFHRWDEWEKILHTLPICFIARPPANYLVKGCPLRQYERVPHHFGTKGRATDLSKNGVYWLKASKMLDISSTQIRGRNNAKSKG